MNFPPHTVNVDGAMDDIARQFKGVSDGLMRIVARSPSATSEPPSSFATSKVAWHADDMNKLSMKSTTDSRNSFSDNEDGDKDIIHGQHETENSSHVNGGHFDNELKEDPTGVPPEVIWVADLCLLAQKELCFLFLNCTQTSRCFL